MGSSAGDAAPPPNGEPTADVFSLAHAAAHQVVESFVQDKRGSPLLPEVWIEVDPWAEDEPVFVFELLVALDDDLDPADFPAAEVEELQDDLRNRILKTEVDKMPWILTTGTKAGAARR